MIFFVALRLLCVNGFLATGHIISEESTSIK